MSLLERARALARKRADRSFTYDVEPSIHAWDWIVVRVWRRENQVVSPFPPGTTDEEIDKALDEMERMLSGVPA
jgi:hypothetical protein